MTTNQALKRASKIWKNPCVKAPRTVGQAYCVGYIALGCLFCVEGQGNSFEEAFENYDEKRSILK